MVNLSSIVLGIGQNFIVYHQFYKTDCSLIIVCVEVLRPSQPNGVMSSAVNLPNHMFTGQA